MPHRRTELQEETRETSAIFSMYTKWPNYCRYPCPGFTDACENVPWSGCQVTGLGNTGDSARTKYWRGLIVTPADRMPLDMRATLKLTQNKLGGPSRSLKREERWLEEVSSKACCSSGALEEKLWVARWWEDVFK